MVNKNVEDAKAFGIIGYIIPLVGIIWYFVDEKMKNNSFANFHAKQMLVLLIVGVIAGFVNVIPILGQLVASVLWILGIVWMIMGIMAVVNGEQKELFLIGQFAKNFNF